MRLTDVGIGQQLINLPLNSFTYIFLRLLNTKQHYFWGWEKGLFITVLVLSRVVLLEHK